MEQVKEFIEKHKSALIIVAVIIAGLFLYSKYGAVVTPASAASNGNSNSQGGLIFSQGTPQSGTGSGSSSSGSGSVDTLTEQESIRENAAAFDQTLSQQNAVFTQNLNMKNEKDQFNLLFDPSQLPAAFQNANANTVGAPSGTVINPGPANPGQKIPLFGRPVNGGVISTSSSNQDIINNNQAVFNGVGDVGPAGITPNAVAGDSPYLSEAFAGITGPNAVGIAQNRYGTSITLPTNLGVSNGEIENLLSGGTFNTPVNNADLIFQASQRQNNANLGAQLLLTKLQDTATLQSSAIQDAAALQSNAGNFEIQGTEFQNAHQHENQFGGGFIGDVLQTATNIFSNGNPLGGILNNVLGLGLPTTTGNSTGTSHNTGVNTAHGTGVILA